MNELSDDEIDPTTEIENDNSPVLFVNQFLPVVEKEAIQAETKESDAEISRSLDFLAKDVQHGVIPSVKTIDKCLRLIGGHFNRKYFFSDELRLKTVNVLLSVYRDKVNVLLSTRTRLLSTVQLVLPKHWSHLPSLTLNWLEFWSELQALVGREERYELRGSEGPLTAHATKLSSFLHSCRHYFTAFTATDDPNGPGSLVISAMSILSDLKQFHIIAEGPLMLLCCLPSTAYSLPQVQALLPRWFDLWSAIDRNSVWDLCWIVILSRAAKYSVKSGNQVFDWSTRLPFLLSKLRDLLKLPASEQTARSRQHHGGSFPRSFAAQYGLYISAIKDPLETQIKKLIKMLLQIIARDTELNVPAERLGITPPAMLSSAMEARGALGYSLPGFYETLPASSTSPPALLISKSTAQVMEFLVGLRPFVHSSNSGQYVGNIAAVTSWLLRGLSAMAGDKAFETIHAEQVMSEDQKRVIVPVSTLRFLLGTCLTILMEGVYTKNTMASRRFAMSLKHIVSLEPLTVHLLMPFFLAALEGKSTNHQPGHTMVALVAINSIARVTLFPQPYLLMYMPELLRLLLPGVDAADSMKSAATLDLLSTLFSMLPISFTWSPKVLPLQSYLQLLDADATGKVSKLSAVSVQDTAVAEQYEAFVSYVTSDWTAAIIERIFILIEGQEQHVKGAKESSISAIVSYFLGFIFQAVNAYELQAEAMSAAAGPLNQFLDVVEKQLVEFVTGSRPPTHTDKVCAKLLEPYLYCHPARLEKVLSKLLTASEVGLKGLASDKLAFRLRMIGGCLRQSHGKQCHLSEAISSRLQALVIDKTLLCHEESKAVRKATMKLAKDFLKGCLSTYVINIHPVYQGRSILAEPAVLRSSGEDITWYAPGVNELKVGVAFVKKTIEHCVSELNAALDQAVLLGQTTEGDGHAAAATASAGGNSGGKMTIKQCEEVVSSQLGLLRRIVRGVAELIIDPFDANKAGSQVPETGRNAYLFMLSESPEDQQFVSSLRAKLFDVLLTSNEKILHAQSPLRTSEGVIKQWMKLAGIIVCRRVAFLKATEQAKKWIQYLNAMGNTIFAASFADRCGHFNTTVSSAGSAVGGGRGGGGLLGVLQENMYWKKHDWNTNTIAVSISLQRQTRGNQYSHSSRRQLVDSDPALVIAHKLLDLTRHEYDAIRPSARKALELVLSGMKYEFNQDIARRLLAAAGNEHGSYYSSASALVLLKQSLFAKRIASDSDLKIAFLRTILPIHRCAAMIEEPDKREKLLLALTDCMLKYTQTWSVSEVELKKVRSEVLPALLARLIGENDSGIITYGLRLDAILGYIILHLISPSLLVGTDAGEEVEVNAAGVMKYLYHHVTGSFGQPVHPIAIAALHRVVESSMHVSVPSAARIVFDPNRESFLKLLQGLARVHPAANADENQQAQQWGRGLDQVLQASSFMQIVRPRSFTCRRHDSNAFSPVFRRDTSALLYGLFTTGFIPLLQSDALGAVLAIVTDPTKLAWGSSESEKRVANVLRAEVFGALLRHFLLHDNEEQSTVAITKLTEAFTAAIEPLSVDYLRDWQEAIHFAMEIVPLTRLVRVKGMIDRALSELGRVLLELSLQSNSVTEEGQGGDGQGFSQQTKALLVVNAFLQSTSIAAVLDKTTSPVSEQVLQLFLAASGGVIAPFRALRAELASLLSSLLDGLSMDERLVSLIQVTMGESALTAITSAEAQTTAQDAASAAASVVVMDTSDPDVPTIAEVSSSTHRLSSAALRRKLISETVCMLVPRLLQRLNLRSSEALLALLVPALAAGIASPDNEVAKMGLDSLLLLYSTLRPSKDVQGTELASIAALQQLSAHPSWHVREAVIKATIALINSPLWLSLTLSAKTVLRDLLAAGLKDERLAVQEIARLGMAAYLSLKSAKDLAVIAAAYTRNSESLADRERQKRRAAGASAVAGGNTDAAYANTVQMLSCIVLAWPYDLPLALPPLLTSLLRHRHYATDSLKAVITSSVQSFRRSHVDRWENDFKLRFTAEQLAELEGAGAAHYFA